MADHARLPGHVSYQAAALLEPLSVATHAVNRARPVPGSTALVLGSGTVGILTAAMARQSGCSSVTIVDIDAGRVDYAVSRGFATHGYVVPSPTHSAPTSSFGGSDSGASTPTSSSAATPTGIFSAAGAHFDRARKLAHDILAAKHPASGFASDEDLDGFDVTFECTGKEVCMHTSLYATKSGGKVVMVGMGTPVQMLPLSVAHLREIDIVGIFRYANTYSTGIRLLCAQQAHNGNGSGIVLPSLDDIVTHRFRGLAAAKEAFELAGRTCDDDGNLVMKVVITADTCMT